MTTRQRNGEIREDQLEEHDDTADDYRAFARLRIEEAANWLYQAILADPADVSSAMIRGQLVIILEKMEGRK